MYTELYELCSEKLQTAHRLGAVYTEEDERVCRFMDAKTSEQIVVTSREKDSVFMFHYTSAKKPYWVSQDGMGVAGGSGAKQYREGDVPVALVMELLGDANPLPLSERLYGISTKGRVTALVYVVQCMGTVYYDPAVLVGEKCPDVVSGKRLDLEKWWRLASRGELSDLTDVAKRGSEPLFGGNLGDHVALRTEAGWTKVDGEALYVPRDAKVTADEVRRVTTVLWSDQLWR